MLSATRPSSLAPASGSPRPTPVLAYVHFPYCLEKCPYCDFVSYKTERSGIDHAGYADAVLGELERRLARLSVAAPNLRLESVFFGGGTPSLWEPRELGRVLEAIRRGLPGDEVEVTAECNPTSLDEERARALLGAGVNRLSIGVQALDDDRLRFLGRLHDAGGGLRAVRDAVAAGVPRVSGDLLYGVAGQPAETAAREAARLVDEGVSHVSAYNLTIESGTRFGELSRRGRLPLAEDSEMVRSFFAVHEALEARGLRHYEISNYGAPGAESRHNLGYWKGAYYLGLGCGAYGTVPDGEGVVRYRNNPLPDRYMRAARGPGALLEKGDLVDSVEVLSPETRLRERIMLGLRLEEGLDLATAACELGVVAWPRERERAAARLIQRGRLLRDGDRLRVPPSSWVFADGTAAELF